MNTSAVSLRVGLLFVLTVSVGTVVAQEGAPSQTFITNVNVWDGLSEELLMGSSVLIEGNNIVGIGTAASDGATVIDGGGRTLMPGLIEMHAHLCLKDGIPQFRDNWDQMTAGANTAHVLLDYLDQGFTTARDAGCNVLGIAKGVNAGYFPGPRIFPSGGFLSQTGGHGDTGYFADPIGAQDSLERAGWSYIVDGRDEVIKAARQNFRAGATQLKIMAGGGVASEFDPLHMTQFSLEENAGSGRGC